MNARGWQAEDDVSFPDVFAGDDVFAIHDADSKACDIIVTLSVEASHFCGLAAKQRAAGLDAGICDALYDLCHQFWFQFAGRNVVEEKERTCALYQDIIDTHSDTVLPDGIMDAHLNGKAQLRADTIRAGDKDRIIGELFFQAEESAESAKIPHDAAGIGRLYGSLDQLYFSFSCIDIDAGFCIGQAFLLFSHSSSVYKCINKDVRNGFSRFYRF